MRTPNCLHDRTRIEFLTVAKLRVILPPGGGPSFGRDMCAREVIARLPLLGYHAADWIANRLSFYRQPDESGCCVCARCMSLIVRALHIGVMLWAHPCAEMCVSIALNGHPFACHTTCEPLHTHTHTHAHH